MNKFCSNCGAKLKANQKFCTECGRKVGESKTSKSTDSKPVTNNKSKVGLIVGISVAAVVVFGLIIGLFVSNIQRVSKYKEDVTNFKTDLDKSFEDVKTVGNQLSVNLYVYTATGTSKYARYNTADSAISAALTSKAIEVARVNSQKPGLEKRYKKLIKFDTKGSEKLEDIKDSLKDVYGEYNKAYKAAIKPVGTPTSIRGDFSEARSAFIIKTAELDRLLKE